MDWILAKRWRGLSPNPGYSTAEEVVDWLPRKNEFLSGQVSIFAFELQMTDAYTSTVMLGCGMEVKESGSDRGSRWRFAAALRQRTA